MVFCVHDARNISLGERAGNISTVGGREGVTLHIDVNARTVKGEGPLMASGKRTDRMNTRKRIKKMKGEERLRKDKTTKQPPRSQNSDSTGLELCTRERQRI